MAEAIGIDSNVIDRAKIIQPDGTPKSEFRILLSIGLYVKDYDKFKSKYSIAMENTFNQLGLPLEKKVYSNYDFIKLHNINHLPIHKIFYNQIRSDIDKLYIYFTAISKYTKMNAYGKKAKEEKIKLTKPYLQGDEIINHLSSSFPLICVWKTNSFFAYKNFNILLDGITPIDFDGWKQISQLPIQIVYNGDRCNSLVSTSDILIKTLDIFMSENKLRFTFENLKSIFKVKNDIEIYPIGKSDFKYISPLSKGRINIEKNIRHPLVFLLNESSHLIKIKELENNREFNKIFDFAYKIDGGVKYFEKPADTQIINESDFIIYFSEEGKKSAEIISKISGATIKDFSKI